jgi:hypothetical protein
MQRSRLMRSLWALGLVASAAAVLADGMVVPQEYYPKVQIPNQQALIHFSDGVERLVIETSFLGAGTNFAWVVPLPSAPKIKPVSESFFSGLQQVFRPRLIHRVYPYYAGVLFVCGLGFLGWRCLKEETAWIVDLPLCVLLAAGAGLLGKHVIIGLLAGALALCMRCFARSSATFALLLLIGVAFAAGLTFKPLSPGLGWVNTLGGSTPDDATDVVAGLTVLAVQRAGVFDATTVRGTSPSAVLEWLERNGYQAPRSAEPAIRDYVQRGWVFVASKARRPLDDPQLAALHPLAFTFPVAAPVYPMKLTATDNGSCAIDLYVLGNRRAAARHFDVVRCERLAINSELGKRSGASELRIADAEILALIGNSTIGTKLSGRLSPAQMASDVEIQSKFFWRKGARVYSGVGALTIALNVAVPLATLAWLLLASCRGGWKTNEHWISRWRRRLVAAALGLGCAVFLLLPKVEVETVSHPPITGLSDD